MKNDKGISHDQKTRSLPKHFLIRLKNITVKVCGKARWFLLYWVFLLVFSVVTSINSTLAIYALSFSEDGKTVKETSLSEVRQFSVNSDGTAEYLMNIGSQGAAVIKNIESGKQNYADSFYMVTDGLKNKGLQPIDMVLTDDGQLYGLTLTQEKESMLVEKETIFRASDKYKYKGDVCDIKYSSSQRTKSSKLSPLHYYNGKVTFARVGNDEVFLYSIDTDTQAVSISKCYHTDPDGTYTSQVIPIDGAFLFFRSNGSVYKTAFDEPLEDEIYRYDIKPDRECSNFFFTQAVMSNGKLYVTDKYHPSEVFCLENKTLTKAYDLSRLVKNSDDGIISIGSYRPAGSDSDVLAVCLKNCLATCSDGKVAKRNVNIKLTQHLLYLFSALLEFIGNIALVGLIINLIIRKKTLLYKQLVTIVPVFLVLTIVIAFNLYKENLKDSTSDIEKDLSIICKLASSEFDDYDFTPLLNINEDTGEAYHQLNQKLDEMSEDNLSNWSKDYIFSIVYRKDDSSTVVLARNGLLSIPMYTTDEIEYSDEDNEDDLNVIKEVNAFMSEKARVSRIYAYEKVSDAGNSGNIYLKVSTEDYSFWLQRRSFLFRIYLYCMLIFLIITALMTANCIRITKAINTANNAIKKIKDGDLSARVKYRSKDELGDICTQVNEMGQSLEDMFREKDRAEKFYYKFVPEKFREFLGKDSFTELSLGDASSRELTVLFCDIRSFSINSEIMTAKENFAFVNVIYGKAGPIIRENNGFIDKYIGDAVMALFENADDAVKCGIELYRSIVLDPKTAEELKISDINIGIGIHSGMAMIGIVGESERLSGTVISDTVNMSSRLESLTKQYKTGMLVSKDTVDRLTDPDSLDMRYVGIIQVAGINEVKGVYEVLDCLDEEQRRQRSGNNRDFREAIRLFHLGRRADAEEALQKLEDSGRNDHVTDMYLKYIRELSDDDKGNVFRFVRK